MNPGGSNKGLTDADTCNCYIGKVAQYHFSQGSPVCIRVCPTIICTFLCGVFPRQHTPWVHQALSREYPVLCILGHYIHLLIFLRWNHSSLEGSRIKEREEERGKEWGIEGRIEVRKRGDGAHRVWEVVGEGGGKISTPQTFLLSFDQ